MFLGVVVVYEKSATDETYSTSTQLKEADLSTTDVFGKSVAMSYDGGRDILTVVVGAPGAPRGSVFIYKKTTTSWIGPQRLISDTESSYFPCFGSYFSILGNVMVLGDGTYANDTDNGRSSLL